MAHVDKLPAVAVVSVTYNRCEPLLVLLRQLRELDFEANGLDVYLVDNASTDDTVARVCAEFPHVQLVLNHDNAGVAAGFNRSIRTALAAAREYKYLWLLDSDAEVEPATLRSLVTAMEGDADLGVVGSSVYDPNARSRLVTAGLRVDWSKGDIPLLVPDGASSGALLDVDLVPACSMLTRAAIYPKVGFWDTRFPLYWGDTDWCARVLAAGARVCCAVSSRVWHRDWSNVIRGFGATIFIRDHVRGGLLFYLRHDPRQSLGSARRLLWKTYLRAALESLTLRRGFRRAYLAAVHDILSGHFEGRISGPDNEPPLQNIELIAAELARILGGRRPRILLNQLPDQSQRQRIRATVERHCGGVDWLEIEPVIDSSGDWSEYRAFKPAQVLAHIGRMWRGMRNIDVNFSSISRPLLYNVFAGRHAVLLDSADYGVIEQNSVMASLYEAASTIFSGLKAAYSSLPHARRSSDGLRAAIAGGDVRK